MVRSPQQSVARGTAPTPAAPAAGFERAFAAVVDLLALTGAGMSTDSGIPDYRGPGSPVRAPMTITEFKSGTVAQQRYWARSHLGWQRMGTAVPNDGHRALAALEHAGYVDALITQNVDGLHQQAGSRHVVDLHGRIDEVICLDCRQITSRVELHHRLDALNPGFGRNLDLASAPDGDVEFDDTAGFRVAGCRRCAGVLKPNVVFFGDSVAKPLVQQCFSAVDAGTPGGGVFRSSSSTAARPAATTWPTGSWTPVAPPRCGACATSSAAEPDALAPLVR